MTIGKICKADLPKKRNPKYGTRRAEDNVWYIIVDDILIAGKSRSVPNRARHEHAEPLMPDRKSKQRTPVPGARAHQSKYADWEIRTKRRRANNARPQNAEGQHARRLRRRRTSCYRMLPYATRVRRDTNEDRHDAGRTVRRHVFRRVTWSDRCHVHLYTPFQANQMF